MSKKLEIVLSGIGNRALPKSPDNSNWMGWVGQIERSPYFQLVAAHDTSKDSIMRIVEKGYLKPRQVYQDIDLMLKKVRCDAMLISNPAEYHGITIRKGLEYDLNLLVEKPFVSNVNEGKKLIKEMKAENKVGAVVQNWRCKDVAKIMYQVLNQKMLGRIGHIFFRYVRNRENPNYPQYIFEQEYPLLYAMGIHHLDLFSYILREKYKRVSGNSFKPPWSMYESDTGVNLFIETESSIPITYCGTISSKNNFLPQESLIIEGEKGSLFTESQWLEPPLWFYPHEGREKIDLTTKIRETSVKEQYDKADKIILENFYRSIIYKENPICSANDGLSSIVIVEASKLACKTGKVIFLEEFFKTS